MVNFQSKKKKNNFLKHPLVLFILLFLLILFIIGVFNLYSKMNDTLKNKEIAENKLKNLEERKEKLLLDIENLSSDKGKEKVFRENYGYGSEGEGVIVIVDDNKNIENTEENSSFWLKIKTFFGF